ncbi:hypothetical protein EDB86DRAFT_2977254 [Lactarius hatsudake]|nr:hypothetical protein EDB86DRAFT_2979186 [Lactarius hatsudake]KAH8981233.1 hypothetical protein EDB86DRAFT_2977254 [Lactarius hatsudake]
MHHSSILLSVHITLAETTSFSTYAIKDPIFVPFATHLSRVLTKTCQDTSQATFVRPAPAVTDAPSRSALDFRPEL